MTLILMRVRKRKSWLASIAAWTRLLQNAELRSPAVVLGISTALVLALVMAVDFPMNTVALRVGEIARQTVRARRGAYYIDRAATQERRQEAESLVPPAYNVDLSVEEEARANVIAAFHELQSFPRTLAHNARPNYKRLRSKLPFQLDDGLIAAALAASPEQLDRAQQEVSALIQKIYRQAIRSDTNDLLNARSNSRRWIADSRLPNGLKELATQIVLKVVYRPNYIYNEEQTERRRRAKSEKVEPAHRRIEAGETIIKAGQQATQTDIDKLVAVGLQSPRVDPERAAALFLLAVFFVAVLGLYMRQYSPHIYENDRLIALLSLIVISALLTFKVLTRFPGMEYVAVPIAATAGMVVSIMLDARFALMVAVMISVLTATISNNELSLCVMSLVSSMVGIYCVSNIHSRAQLIRTGFILGGVNLVLSAILGALTGTATSDVLAEMSWGLGSGVVCAMLTVGLVMFLERPFGVTTHLRLLELSDPNEPILKRLQLEAPGTCTHSIMVANLAESAAKAIGADALLTRVASYYHDIGKVKRPYCFAENQFAAENIHDRLTPTLSTLAIIAHVKEGIEMAKELRLPQAIIDMIPQHHGTNLVSYFYSRALESQVEGQISDAGFRYPGPKPQTREAGVIMLADGVEAAVRSLSNPTHARIEAMVRKIIRERLDDGQLSECNLTLKELEIIAKTFTHMLKGLTHTRVEYPDQERDMPAIHIDTGRARRRGETADARIGGHARIDKGAAKETTDSPRYLRRITGRGR